MKKAIGILAGVLLVLSVAPSAQAAGTVGASGSCKGDNSLAGQTDVFDNQDDGADVGVGTSGVTDMPDSVDIAHALGNYAEGQSQLGTTDSCPNSAGDSWVEVHAGPAGACYDGDVSVDTNGGSYDDSTTVVPSDNGGAEQCHKDDGSTGDTSLTRD